MRAFVPNSLLLPSILHQIVLFIVVPQRVAKHFIPVCVVVVASIPAVLGIQVKPLLGRRLL